MAVPKPIGEERARRGGLVTRELGERLVAAGLPSITDPDLRRLAVQAALLAAVKRGFDTAALRIPVADLMEFQDAVRLVDSNMRLAGGQGALARGPESVALWAGDILVGDSGLVDVLGDLAGLWRRTPRDG